MLKSSTHIEWLDLTCCGLGVTGVAHIAAIIKVHVLLYNGIVLPFVTESDKRCLMTHFMIFELLVPCN